MTMSYTEWEILCDWQYAMSHPQCFFHEPGPGFEFWQLATVWIAFVVVAGVLNLIRK
jgi:hypothetical protein